MKKHYVLFEGEFFRMIPQKIAAPNDLIAQLGANAFSASFLFGEVQLTHPANGPAPLPLYGRAQPNGNLLLFVKLPFMQLISHYAFQRDTYTMDPRGGGSGRTSGRPVWTPPASMSVFFGLHMDKASRGSTPYTRVALNNAPGDYLLPLGNIHSNGKICMGGDWTGIREEAQTPAVFFEQALAHFQNSSWNADLLGDGDGDKATKMKRMFRFDADWNQKDITGAIVDSLVVFGATPQVQALNF